MGFRFSRTHELKFEGTELEGLEVTVKSGSVADTMTYLDLLVENSDDSLKKAIAIFTKHIVSWNLEDENGKPVEISAENVLGQHEVLVRELASTWLHVTRGVTAPLGRTSSDGEPSQEQ